MGMILDFTGPGQIKMGDEIIPMDRTIPNDSKKERSARMSKEPSKARPDGARVGLCEVHPLKLPTIMGSGALQK